jgi:hypothetical protein
MFEKKAMNKALGCGNKIAPAARAVTGIDGKPFPAALESITFSELEKIIAATQADKYDN